MIDDTNTKGTSSGLHNPSVHVGIPASDIQDDWVTTYVFFHGFAKMPTERGKFVLSPKFYCLGHEWSVALYPRGKEGVADGMISVSLTSHSSHTIIVDYAIAVRDLPQSRRRERGHEFNDIGDSNSNAWKNFLRREVAIGVLYSGALVIKVQMAPAKNYLPPFIPKNPFACKAVQDMFMDEESADIVFEVGGQHATTSANTKKRKSVHTRFYAHRLILMKVAPLLAELCVTSHESPQCIGISNISPDVFEIMLLQIYGHQIQFEKCSGNHHALIEAANKYGLTNLKLEAEADYVSCIKKTFDLQNIMEHLLDADAMNLAYLREVVVDFIVENKMELMKQNVLMNAPGGVLNDVLAAMARSEAKAGTAGKTDEVELGTLCISELRRRAYAHGLCVDGSRETLIAALASKTVVVENDE